MIKIFKTFTIFTALFFCNSFASATTLSPLIIDSSINPGESATYEIKLYNETESDIFLNGTIEKFIPKGERGEVDILPFDISDVSVNWIKLPVNSLVLQPGEAISVPVIIKVPTTADVGGYYLAIMWESSASLKTGQNQTNISSRVGTLLLLDVMGDTKKELQIVDFNLVGGKNFYTTFPINFTTRLTNYGSAHQRPEGAVIIKNIFGKVTDIIKFNIEDKAILPNTIRIFESSWDIDNDGFLKTLISQIINFKIGIFTASVVIESSGNSDLISDNISFWVFPWQASLTILFILVVFLWIFFKTRRIR